MVSLGCTLEDFSSEDWTRAFQAYVKANNSHWTGPPYDVVKKILEEKGVYEFGFQSMGTWGSKFRLVMKNGGIHAEFVKNSELSGRMAARLDEMERAFRQLLEA